MQDDPGPSEILRAVAAFLRDTLVPLLPPREAFDARVAANALDLVQRDIAVGRSGEAAEAERLRALLGRNGSLAELNAALSERLRAEGPDAVTPAQRDHLWATTLEKLSVDQPKYSAYLRALEERAAGER